MTETFTKRFEAFVGGRARLAFAAILVGLGTATVATWAVGRWDVDRLEASATDEQVFVVRHALDRISEEFRSLQEDMLEEARSLATHPEIVLNLRRLRAGDRSGEEGVVRIMAAYALREHGSVEVYDQQPRIIGWSGLSMPLDASPSEPGFLEVTQTSLAFDGDRHAALVVWWPVRDGTDMIGAVRVFRMIVKHVPVRNEFLKDYTLDEEWSRMTRLSVRVDLGPGDSRSGDDLEYSRLLQGLDGEVLARVTATPPDVAQLTASLRNRYTDVVFFWLVLGMTVLLVALGRWTLGGRRSEPEARRPLYRFGWFAIGLAAARYLLLVMEVPSRWQQGKAPLSPLFDPRHLASDFGFGLMQTSGDLLLTSILAVILSLVFVRATEPVRSRAMEIMRQPGSADGPRAAREEFQTAAVFGLHALIVIAIAGFLATIARNAVLDSTLDFFERSGLMPQRLVLIVFAALLLLTFAFVFIGSRSLWVCVEFVGSGIKAPARRPLRIASATTGVVLVLLAAYVTTDLSNTLAWGITVGFLVAIYIVALFSPLKSDRVADWLHLRSVIPSVVLISLLLYPILENGLEIERRLRMQSAAASFDEEMDTRVLFAMGQILDRSDEIDVLYAEQMRAGERASRYDSIARELTHGELIASLGSHDISVSIMSLGGEPLGRYADTRRRRSRALMDEADRDRFDLIRAMYIEQGDSGVLMEKMTGSRERERFVYEGFSPVFSGQAIAGWLMIRAEPQDYTREGTTPFPRVLVPAGYYGEGFANLSLSEFQDGILIRSYGRSFGRYALDESIEEALKIESPVWRVETVREKEYLTLYQSSPAQSSPADVADPIIGSRTSIIAVRVPGTNFFDHLYYLLRITIAGLLLGIPVYIIGIVWRRRVGLLPSKQVHFRDKVLNAFFVVGTITVAAMGWVGLQVVTGENDNAIESWLRQHLERVEDALAIDARGEELPYRVLERFDLDSLAARVGLNLNIYRAIDLERSSRPQLVRERLIDSRLPIDAYEALYFDGFRFVSVDQQIGSFSYTAGYRALTDERGMPRYVISLPTLPEQERIEEERARTVAYLFGALLLLVLVVMVTAALLANALSRPVARLRAGLQAVAQGRFETIGPVRSRDEIGELVDTFNTMQEQLVESRAMLAQHERQLAWREMARQVAHEIKNPLTPMKLSIQHLRAAFSRNKPETTGAERPGKEVFASKFNRTTTTLIEQIDALARIADEFSSFGRMPQHVSEPLDLNIAVEEAVSLMQNETKMSLVAELGDGPMQVNGDKEALRRLFINLIKNAIQAIPADRDGLIRIKTRRVDEDTRAPLVLTELSDNGIGIPKALWEKIFVPSFSTKTSGTGLGLALAQKTVEDMAGEIGFETEDGVGTTFHVRLPLAAD